MGFSLLNVLIILYILSLVGCLIACITGKIMPLYIVRIFIAIHIIAAVMFLFYYVTGSSNKYALSFAFFICMGMVCFGLVIRKKFRMLLKIYFSIFLFIFPVFLVSPSYVFSVLSAGVLKNNSRELAAGNNFYLLRQNAMFSLGADESYKIIEKRGFFSKTISRNIQLRSVPDSARILRFDKNSEISLRTYYRNSQINLISDSEDVVAPVVRGVRDTLIQIKKTSN